MLASACRRCGQKLDAATAIDGDNRPTPGAVSICFYCGTVSLYDDGLALREPTIAELDEVLDDATVAKVLSHLWDARLARVIQAVEGVEFACGCHTTATGGLFTLEACSATCAAARTIFRMMRAQGKPMMLDPDYPGVQKEGGSGSDE